MKSFDIVIVGGGIVGASLACALAARTTLTIGVVEAKASRFPRFRRNDYDFRVSALTLASKHIFENLNIWQSIADTRISPFEQITVWDDCAAGEINFASRHIAEVELGYIIENNLLLDTLYHALTTQYTSQVTWLAETTLQSVQTLTDSIECTTTTRECIKAQLVVAADGAKSWLRDHLQIAVKRYDYQQLAIVATVASEFAHERIARQVFLAHGPLAFLPLADKNLSSIVWSLPKEDAQTLMALSQDEFKTQLGQAFGDRLGRITDCGQRYTFPLIKQETAHYIKPRIALVGDAAHTVHPLAGLGFNMGLLDIATLVEVIEDALIARKDFAAERVLRRYERWRKADNFALLSGIDVLKRLFTTQNKTVQRLRSLGLNATNHLPFVRDFFTRFAVGKRKDLPRLASPMLSCQRKLASSKQL